MSKNSKLKTKTKSKYVTRPYGLVAVNLSNERLSFGFPDSYRCKMKCATAVTIGATAPAPTQYYSMLGNSCFSIGPSINGGGYNANYAAGIAALFSSSEAGTGDVPPYTKYRVHSSKFTWRYTPYGTTGSAVRIVSWPSRIDAPNLGTSAFATVAEQAYVKTVLFSGSATIEARTHSQTMSSTKMFGVPSIMIETNDFACSGAGRPDNSFYWNWYCFPDGTGAIIGALELEVDYDVEFYARATVLSGAP